MIRRDAFREYSRSSLWFLPAVAAVAAIAVGAVLSRIPVPASSLLAFQGTADDARSLLITIAGTMVTVIALLLGLAVVALQLSSTQFSPRLLRNFLRDRPNQVVLSVFVATFTYSAAGLFDVGIAGGVRVDKFPRFAVTVAIGLMFLSLALLVFFADHLAHSIQIDRIMQTVEQNTLETMRSMPPGAEAPPVPPGATAVPALTSGYVQYVNTRRLLATAAARGVNVRLRPRVGEHVAEGTTLAWIWPAEAGAGTPNGARMPDGAGSAAWLRPLARIGFERTLEQDPSLGLRQLVDSACKALSPAVNDPYTAIQAVDHLSVLYGELARRRVGPIVCTDPSGRVTVTIPARTLAEHLEVGMGLIRRYGASEPTVVQALLRCLVTVLNGVGDDAEGLRAVEWQADLLVRAADSQVAEPSDLAGVRAENDELRQALSAHRLAAGERLRPDRDSPATTV